MRKQKLEQEWYWTTEDITNTQEPDTKHKLRAWPGTATLETSRDLEQERATLVTLSRAGKLTFNSRFYKTKAAGFSSKRCTPAKPVALGVEEAPMIIEVPADSAWTSGTRTSPNFSSYLD